MGAIVKRKRQIPQRIPIHMYIDYMCIFYIYILFIYIYLSLSLVRTRASHGSVGLPLAFVFGREWNGTAREKGRNQHDNKRVFQLQMAYITTWSLSF